MPRFRVTETRARTVVYLIDAVDERAAEQLDGDVIDESGDDYSLEAQSVEQVSDEEEDA